MCFLRSSTDSPLIVEGNDRPLHCQITCKKGVGLLFASITIISSVALFILLVAPALPLSLAIGVVVVTALGGIAKTAAALLLIALISSIVAAILLRKKSPPLYQLDDSQTDLRKLPAIEDDVSCCFSSSRVV